MKKRILIALSVMLVMALAAVVFAYNNTTGDQTASVSHCEMMKKHHASMTADADRKDSCCDNCEHCKDGNCPLSGDCDKDNCPMNKDNCPMKNKDAQTSAGTVDMKNVPVTGDGEHSCPHKKS